MNFPIGCRGYNWRQEHMRWINARQNQLLTWKYFCWPWVVDDSIIHYWRCWYWHSYQPLESNKRWKRRISTWTHIPPHGSYSCMLLIWLLGAAVFPHLCLYSTSFTSSSSSPPCISSLFPISFSNHIRGTTAMPPPSPPTVFFCYCYSPSIPPDTPAAVPWYFLFPRVNQAAPQIETHLCNRSYFSWWLTWVATHTHTHGYTQHKLVSFITQYVIPSGMLLGILLTDKQISDSGSGKCDAGRTSTLTRSYRMYNTCSHKMTVYQMSPLHILGWAEGNRSRLCDASRSGGARPVLTGGPGWGQLFC